MVPTPIIYNFYFISSLILVIFFFRYLMKFPACIFFSTRFDLTLEISKIKGIEES